MKRETIRYYMRRYNQGFWDVAVWLAIPFAVVALFIYFALVMVAPLYFAASSGVWMIAVLGYAFYFIVGLLVYGLIQAARGA